MINVVVLRKMNNKEKRKYMTDLLVFQSTPFMSEFETRKDFLKKTPIILYKYRPFDKYALEMIENGYATEKEIAAIEDQCRKGIDLQAQTALKESGDKLTETEVLDLVYASEKERP